MKTQNWTIGQTVKVGFLQLKVISDKIATPGNNAADEYALESLNGDKFYRFAPHRGVFRVKNREVALSGRAMV